VSYLVTGSRDLTAFAKTMATAAEAIGWIQARRALGAARFEIVDGGGRKINEADLARLAEDEPLDLIGQIDRPPGL
jgi:hypothetical protein